MIPLIRPAIGLLMLSTLTACGSNSAAPRNAQDQTVDPDGLKAFIGSLHEHSGFSDGTVGTSPADYFAAGRELGLDFVGSSEHSDNARLPLTVTEDCLSPELPDCVQAPPEGLLKWEATLDLATAATDMGFTAIRGFEWTSDRFGHINVYFSTHDLNAKTGLGYLVSMEQFWTWFETPADLLGGADGLAVFNHPGREDTLHTACENLGPLADACGTVFNGDPAYTWNDFALRPGAVERVVGIEMYGKSGHYYDGDNGAPPGGWYAYALDRGWYLAPVGAEDEHGTRWAQPERAKTVILASDRSPQALREAMLARRFYALAHAYNDLRIDLRALTADGAAHPMGRRLNLADGEAMTLQASVSGLAAPRLELVGSGGAVIATSDTAELSITVTPSAAEQWHFVRVIDRADADGDDTPGEVVAVSAPIWWRAAGN